MIFGTILTLAALFAIGAPGARRANNARTWVVYVCLFAIVGVFTMVYIMEHDVSGPLEWMFGLFRDRLG